MTRTGFTIVLPALLLVSFLSFWPRGKFGTFTSLAFTLALFGLALAGLWAGGLSDTPIISGLLPWSDANGYYMDAQRLLQGGHFSVFSSRRPFFAGFLAALLAFCGRNLTLTVSLLTLITAISCYLAARVIFHSHGAVASAIFLTVLFFFYRRFAGTTMTENLGLSLGSLGFALLWSQINQNRHSFLFGLAVLTLGLVARAGPLFILPALVLWAGVTWKTGRCFSLRSAAAATAVIAAVFGINYLFFFLLGDPSGAPFSNFSFSFYGVATGNTGWAQIYQDHPEIFELNAGQQAGKVLAAAFESIRARPLLLVKGILAQYQYLVSNSWYNAYGYLRGDSPALNLIVQVFFFGLAAVGLAGAWLKRREAHMGLLLALVAGLFLSVPFVPPRDTNRMRAYAAAIPILAVLPAIGADFLIRKFLPRFFLPQGNPKTTVQVSTAFSGLLVAILLIGPLLIRQFARPIQPGIHSCPGNAEALEIYFTPGSSINIIPESVFLLDWLPNFHQGRFLNNLHALNEYEFVTEMEHIKAPLTIFPALVLQDNSEAWILADTTRLPQTHGLVTLCGSWHTTTAGRQYRLFDAESGFP